MLHLDIHLTISSLRGTADTALKNEKMDFLTRERRQTVVPVVFNQSEFILGPPPPRSGPDRQIGILRVDIELVDSRINITLFIL